MLDHSHQIRCMEDDCSRIIGGDIREPLNIAAGEVPGILRHQGIEAALVHVISDQLPSPIEFLNGDPGHSTVICFRTRYFRGRNGFKLAHHFAVSASIPNPARRDTPLKKNAAVAATADGTAMT